MSFGIDDPNDKLIASLYSDFEEVSKENALKLKQILDLEDILYNTNTITEEDGSPCWCCIPSVFGQEFPHDDYCERARKATEHLWKH